MIVTTLLSHFSVRHPRARADSEIEKEHDTFSLVKIISREFPDVEAQVKDISLLDDLQWINHFLVQMLLWTGSKRFSRPNVS